MTMASPRPFTIIDENRVTEVEATVCEDRVHLSAASLETAIGWTLKPQGLCRGDVCVRAGKAVDADGIDLAAAAALLGRPLALDAEEGVAALGTSASDRGRQLASLEAPDFELPDLDGTSHRLSDYRGRKILLVAYASW